MSIRNCRLSLLLAIGTLLSCGYHVGGKGDLLPKSLQTIAIPAFNSYTTDYRLGDVLPNAIAHEFIARTRFQIVTDPQTADAELRGSITRVMRAPILSNPNTGLTTSVQYIVTMDLKLVERSTGKVLFSRIGYGIRENYEMSNDPHVYLDESAPAVNRLSRDIARDIVTSVLENF